MKVGTKIYEIGTGYTPIPAQMGAATEIVVEELTKAFMTRDINVTIVDIASDNRKENNLPIIEVPVPKVFKGTDVKLGILHKLKRIIYSISLSSVLKKIIKNSDDEIIFHFHNQYNLYFFIKLTSKAVREKVKIAYTVHSYIWADEWKVIKDIVKKRYFQEIYCVKNADYVFVLNSKTTEHFEKHLGVDKNNIYNISNGVNTDIYNVLSDIEINAFKDSIGLTDKKIILQVGSVCERKNQMDAVSMLRPYLEKHRDTVYIYAGGIINEEYNNLIRTFAVENDISDQVIYAGELCPGKQLNNYYNAANITVFPSKVESFGLVIIESLSAGTPILLTGKPLFDLETGYSTFTNSDEFIDLIKKNINASGRREDNRVEIIEKYSWNAVALQHYNIWKNGK